MLRREIGPVPLPLAFLTVAMLVAIFMSSRIPDTGTRATVVTVFADVLKMVAGALVWAVFRGASRGARW
jgi:hypothetical protein